jgi:hypothetical protein
MRNLNFMGKLLAVAVPFLGMMAINYVVDPASVFHDGPEAAMAAMLLAGRPVAGVIDYDERLVQKYVIDGLRARLDVVVVGSSRAMAIRAGDFSGTTFYNFSVSAAVMDDLIALSGELAAKDRLPKRVILGIDPWLFSRAARHDGWKAMRAAHDELLGTQPGMPRPASDRLAVIAGLPPRYSELVSPAYLQASLRSAKAEGGRTRPRAPAPDESGGVISPDGSHIYPLTNRSRGLEQIRQAAVRYTTEQDAYLEGFTELDGELADRLRALLRFLRSRGVAVDLLLVPFHPRTYDLLARSPTRIDLAAEPFTRRLADQAGVPVIGSFDPRRSGCDETEFLDGVHPRESCIRRVLTVRSLSP